MESTRKDTTKPPRTPENNTGGVLTAAETQRSGGEARTPPTDAFHLERFSEAPSLQTQCLAFVSQGIPEVLLFFP